MSKNIWIINDYAGSPYHGMEFRHYYIGKELIKLGNSVTIVGSSYSHLFKNLPTKRKELIDEVSYLWIKTLNYGDSHDKRRVLKWLKFSFKIFFLPFTLKNPDVIIVSPMAPFSIFPAWVLSKIYKAKLIYEVKDIWPLSLIELGQISSSHPLIKSMSFFERFAINKSDIIVSNLQNYTQHVQMNLKINKTAEWISNGIDLTELKQVEPLDKIVEETIPKNKFIVGYVGTIGVANALDSFLKSAKQVENETEILFVIVGRGKEKENLIKNFNQPNILFINAIDKKQVQSMLALFDVCYIGLKNENLFKYGVSPNKLYDYMYSAKPVLYAINSGTNIVDVSNCGISVEAESNKEISQAILKFYRMTQEERDSLGSNGKKYVLKHFTYEELTKKYIELF